MASIFIVLIAVHAFTNFSLLFIESFRYNIPIYKFQYDALAFLIFQFLILLIGFLLCFAHFAVGIIAFIAILAIMLIKLILKEDLLGWFYYDIQ